MVHGLLGKKIGMTQIFDENGRVFPVTIVQAGPCVVVQKKTSEKEAYDAVQLGFVEGGRVPRVGQPLAGHFKKAGVPPTRVLAEFSQIGGDGPEVGAQLVIGDVFEVKQRVNVQGITIGRGFQGVMKRHKFSGGRATHGSMFHRAPGSIGASASPSRVFKGMKGAGRMGNRKVTVRNLQIVAIDPERNLLLLFGAVPGSRGGYLRIVPSSKQFR